MAQRRCDSCRESYEAKRPSSRFCSDRCRKRGQRGHVVSLPTVEPEAPEGRLGASTLASLAEVGREDTPLGTAALIAAERIDAGQDTGAGLAAIMGRFQALLAAALEGAKRESHVDDLREKRAARRSG